MERLTERAEVNNRPGIWVEKGSADKRERAWFYHYDRGYSAINKLVEYEDLEEQGLLLKLPVAIGDTVYITNGCSLTVREIHIQDNLVKYFVARFNPDGLDVRFAFDRIGKTVFFTQAEAEKALKRMKKKK